MMRKPLVLGTYVDTGELVLIDPKIGEKNIYLCGPPGMGKSTTEMLLLRQWAPDPCVVIDRKGDRALMNYTRELAKKNDQPFYIFNIESNHRSAIFDPFKNLTLGKRPVVEYAELIISALNLNKGGDVYGASHFAALNEFQILRLLHELKELEARGKGKMPENFPELFARLERKFDSNELKAVTELLTTIYALSQYPQLVTSDPPPPDTDVIHMPNVVKENAKVYFWLPAKTYGLSGRYIGRLAIYAFSEAMDQHIREGGTGPGRLIVDEAQHIAAENIKVLYQQCRDILTIVFSNQKPEDLKLRYLDLQATVFSMSPTQLYFGLDGDRRKELVNLCGQHEVVVESVSSNEIGIPWLDWPAAILGGLHWNTTKSVQLRDRLTADMINSTNKKRGEALLFLTQEEGVTEIPECPVRPIKLFYPTTLEEHKRLNSIPPPRTPEDMPRGVPTSGTEEKFEEKKKEAAERARKVRDAFGQQPPRPPQQNQNGSQPKKRGGKRKGKSS